MMERRDLYNHPASYSKLSALNYNFARGSMILGVNWVEVYPIGQSDAIFISTIPIYIIETHWTFLINNDPNQFTRNIVG